jgi:iron(III) transport system permease protein
MIVLLISVVLPIATLAAEVGQLQRLLTALQSMGPAIWNSLITSTLGATLCVAVGVLLGYGRARLHSPLKGFIDLSFLSAFAVPGTVIGVGLIGLWNRPGVMGEVYKSPFIIVLAYLARFVPVAALVLAATASQIPRSFEEAAETAGSGWLRTFLRILVPQMHRGILAAWVVSFIFAFGELGTTLLVSPPGESTLPVRIYTLIANAPASEVAALALMQSAIVVGLLFMLGMFVRLKAREYEA